VNLPNRLTLTRIILIPFFLVALHIQLFTVDPTICAVCYGIALLLFIVAAITDYLDGAIARKLNIVTNFGKLFDPLADKLLTMAAFVSFVEILGPNGRPIFPAWAIILILGREYLVTGLRSVAVANGSIIHADKWGKQKTIWQLIGIITVLTALTISETLMALNVNGAAFNKLLPAIFVIILLIVVVLTTLSGIIFLIKNWSVLVDTE
jgi:CDP-diacylglycerol--glycerol-3-phosphate 3-phosphatidyltransferase